jgi:hypothetical protein
VVSNRLQAISAADVGLDDGLVAVTVLLLVGGEWLRNREALAGGDLAQVTVGYLTGLQGVHERFGAQIDLILERFPGGRLVLTRGNELLVALDRRPLPTVKGGKQSVGVEPARRPGKAGGGSDWLLPSFTYARRTLSASADRLSAPTYCTRA